MRANARWFAVVGLFSLVAVGCGGSKAGETPLMAEGSDAYPHATLADWVTYGDAVVVFEVIAEKEIPPSRDELEAGEGLIMRELQARVEDLIWVADGASTIPTEFTFVSNGWSFKGSERRPMTSEGAGRLEVGRQYVGPVSPRGSRGWYPMHPAETMDWTNDRASLETTNKGDGVSRGEAVEQVAGLNAQEIAVLLERQAPDPTASKDRSLSPRERFGEVTRQLEAGD
jgi:hypothetical protein